MPRDPSRTLRRRLADVRLTTDPTQRLRLAQAGLAMVLMAFSVAILVYAARLAGTPAMPVAAWAALSLGGMAAFFAAIRFGWSRRFRDPSLTVAQMVFALTSGAVAYAMAGPMRGATFAVLLAILMFGMFQLRPRALARVSLYALGLFGAVMAWWLPQVDRPAVELGHFLMLAATLPAVSLLAGRLTALRERSRRQRHDLAEALARGGVERVRQHIEAVSLLVGEPGLRVTISAGPAEHIAGESVATALARADAALYEAKAQGRNRALAASA
jgi:hypothetical protein